MTEVQKVLETYGKQVLAEMKNRLINADKVASGTLLNSLEYKVEKEGKTDVLNIYGESYLDYVDKGRPPGKMPPVQAIRAWCKIRGIPEKAAYPIAVNIGKFGVKPSNFFTISVTRRAKQLDKLLEAAAAQDAINLLPPLLQ